MKSQSPISPGSEPLLRPVMPELDSIRGLAILMVLLYHAFYWQNDFHGLPRLARAFTQAMWIGRLGVNLFFVLSGFLITGILLQSRSRRDYYRRFYVRRALRILPAYYALLFILLSIHPSSMAFVGLSAVYMSNLAPLFGVAMSYPVLWSLAVEEHFYLAWPFLVRKLTTSHLLVCCITIVILTPMLRWISFWVDLHRGHVSFTFNNYTWNSADGLALGALLVIMLRQFAWSRRTLLCFSVVAVLAGAALWFGGIPFGILSRESTAVGAALQATPWNLAFTGLLGLTLLAGTSKHRALVLMPALRFLGRVSYGLYLIHLLIFEAYDRVAHRTFPALESLVGRFPQLVIRFACASGIAIALALASRVAFEEPFLQMRDRFDHARSHSQVNLDAN